MDDRLKAIREKADALGVPYHHRANADTIQIAVNAKLVEMQEKQLDITHPDREQFATNGNGEGPPPFEKPITELEWRKKEAAMDTKLAGALIRIRIQNMNPTKKDWNGEFISVGSAKLGTFKKFIPFNSGEPYHVPRIIYNEMKAKKCSQFYNVVDPRTRQKTRKSKQINEYVIEELDPLTPQELKELALKQAMAEGQGA